MSNGDHARELAALTAVVEKAITPRLDRMEAKLDRSIADHSDLRVKVAGWAAGVAVLVSGIVTAGARLLGGG